MAILRIARLWPSWQRPAAGPRAAAALDGLDAFGSELGPAIEPDVRSTPRVGYPRQDLRPRVAPCWWGSGQPLPCLARPSRRPGSSRISDGRQPNRRQLRSTWRRCQLAWTS